MNFQVAVPQLREAEAEGLRRRLGCADLEEVALLGLSLLDAISRHLQHADAEVRLYAPEIGEGQLDVSLLRHQMQAAK